jgi:hypothetical protein
MTANIATTVPKKATGRNALRFMSVSPTSLSNQTLPTSIGCGDPQAGGTFRYRYELVLLQESPRLPPLWSGGWSKIKALDGSLADSRRGATVTTRRFPPPSQSAMLAPASLLRAAKSTRPGDGAMTVTQNIFLAWGLFCGGAALIVASLTLAVIAARIK